MAPTWHVLVDVLILLTAALALGTLAEWLRQSAILGYLVAGTLVGPNMFGWVTSGHNVKLIAELGVALLLFTIGLEFSFDRLKRIGPVALIGGSLQVIVTMAVAGCVANVCGLDYRGAVAVGAMLALSSTACVLRLLTDRAAVDSMYGRHCLGILLLQDVAVIPLVLLVASLAGGGSWRDSMITLARTVALGGLLIGVFLILFKMVVPRLFNMRQWTQNRELPILLAMVMAIGSAVASHQASISPAIGAFVAGVLLGESPFAIQIRADVGSIRTVFVTLFFATVGMFGEPVWVAHHAGLVMAVVTAIVVGKTVIIIGIVRLLGVTTSLAVATGLCLAQVGEFSFVLAETARGQLISEDVFRLMVSATILTLFLTPFLVIAAPHLANWLTDAGSRARPLHAAPRSVHKRTAPNKADRNDGANQPVHDAFIIGFGPAGQQAAQALLDNHADRMVVIELNPRNTAIAKRYGVTSQVGDATHRDVLEHANIRQARVIIVTVPDPKASRAIIHHCKYLAPNAIIIARARYHVVRWDLQLAGAIEVIDEEEQIGVNLASRAKQYLNQPT